MVRVRSVAPDSLAAELEITPGTELLAINGRPLDDFLDWEFLSADDAFVLRARTAAGQDVEYDIERPDDLPMG
ncbi:MAG TPA: PDZ domain-containing protein, partial [Gemmatimonadales bacterium]|nr:PDZ domain-containing protein [Gemmatimonadales bacterium]